mmetsp:Transcript_1003/g.2870  ORF Transcript_1003/g.2870 Transcript_1003/m.2870 type:complete len:239 (-) Transcript_1003:1500-2216(-)
MAFVGGGSGQVSRELARTGIPSKLRIATAACRARKTCSRSEHVIKAVLFPRQEKSFGWDRGSRDEGTEMDAALARRQAPPMAVLLVGYVPGIFVAGGILLFLAEVSGWRPAVGLDTSNNVPLRALLSLTAFALMGGVAVNMIGAVRDTVANAKRLHQIPCSTCHFACSKETQNRLKCSLWNEKAGSTAAIGCIDYINAVTGKPADPSAEDTRELRILQSYLDQSIDLSDSMSSTSESL